MKPLKDIDKECQKLRVGMMMSREEVPHDALRHLIALKAKEIFGISCITLQEVHAEAGTRRADLVLITEMSPYPFVRAIEVKTKAEDVWKAFEQLLWFKERGLLTFTLSHYLKKSMINICIHTTIFTRRT